MSNKKIFRNRSVIGDAVDACIADDRINDADVFIRNFVYAHGGHKNMSVKALERLHAWYDNLWWHSNHGIDYLNFKREVKKLINRRTGKGSCEWFLDKPVHLTGLNEHTKYWCTQQ